MKKIFIFLICSHSIISYSNVEYISRNQYIDKWENTAINQMIQYNIPASITLAQGILESSNGNSKLALKGNNHFGIKCHGWKGKEIYLDDDKPNECFRVYKNADESYKDHSLFLKKYSRYKSLFNLDIYDYKGWAKGLKAAGYATNPKYADLLITIIEKEKLYLLDKKNLVSFNNLNSSVSANFPSRLQFHKNHVKYIRVIEGDTYYKIAKQYGITLRQLYKYNDFHSQKDFLENGDIVCLSPKKRKSSIKKLITSSKTTLFNISQEFGIKIKSLLKLNPSISSIEIIDKKTLIFLK